MAAMTRGDAQRVAVRWAELWAQDYRRMVEEIYAPHIVLEHAGHGVLHGRDQLLATEGRLLEMIPDHANELLRVIDGDEAVVIESVITGTTPGDPGRQACPACVWWWFDDDGRVRYERAYWEWAKRRPVDEAVAGTLRDPGARDRSADWGRRQAHRMAQLWTTDPVEMVDELYAEDCVAERLGEGPEAVLRGAEALREAERALLDLLPRPHRQLQVRQVSAADGLVAVAVEIEGRWKGTGPRRRGPGALVLTFNADGRVVSDRIYWHWDRAREVDA